MAINLSRNTKVYFTTNVNATTGAITDAASGFTNANTFEIAVQDGYSLSQNTGQQTIQISEAGETPSRGQRAFNTQLDPVDFSFSTYIRPQTVSTFVTAAEKVLWNALLGAGAYDDAGAAVTSLTRATTATATATLATTATLVIGQVVNVNGAAPASWNQAAVVAAIPSAGTYTVTFSKAPLAAAGTTATVTSAKAYTGQWAKGAGYSYVSTMGSNKNQLQKFGMIFVIDQALYAVDNCAMDQVSVDFGLDAISMAAWSGKGTVLKKLSTLTGSHLVSNSLVAPTDANYITNKLSTMSLASNIGGSQHTTAASTAYSIPITGGNITIANNLNYLVPTNLGVVNLPIGYYTGQRAISGNVTAYLRTGGSNDSGALLQSLLTGATTTTEPKYAVQLEMGGVANSVKVEFDMSGVVLQIPAIDVADIVSTTINFTAQGYNPDVIGNQTFEITNDNDLTVRYYSPA